MRYLRLLSLLGLLSGLLLPAARGQQLRWSQLTRFGGNDQQTGQPDEIVGMVTDSAGNFYVAGTYTYGTNLGGLTWPFVNRLEGFVARFDGAGTFQWVRTIIGPGDEHVRGLCLGPRGQCFITGDHEAGATTDAGVVEPRMGVFVAAFDPLGNRTWYDTVFSATLGLTTWDIAVDRAGACYLSGFTAQSTLFGSIPLTIPTNWSAKMPFVAKYSPTHTPEWIQGSTTSGSGGTFTLPCGILADSSGCYVALQHAFTNGLILGVPIRPTTRAGLDIDGVIVHLNRAGNPVWYQTISNPGATPDGTVVMKTPVQRFGKLLVSGYCDSVTTFSGTVPTILRSRRRRSLTFTATYDMLTGDLDTVEVVARGLPNTSHPASYFLGEMTETPAGRFAAGLFAGTVAFGSNQLTSTTSAFFHSGMLAHFSTDGTCVSVLPLRGGQSIGAGGGASATLRAAARGGLLLRQPARRAPAERVSGGPERPVRGQH